MMNTHMATLGPASHCHQVMPRNRDDSRADGGESTPTHPNRMWTIPRGSLNQLGPSMLSFARNAFTVPLALNKNRNTTVIATELVTDGK
jgi:hypothetical protein